MPENTTPQATTSFVPPITSSNHSPKYDPFSCNLSGAFYWYGYDLQVIPVVPVTKKTAVKWNPWLEDYDTKSIYDYWNKNPQHELGFIVGDDMIVFDADSPESIVALKKIEARFAVEPRLVVKTTKGEHHYYRRSTGTIAKSDSHSSETFPDRIDIKTGRALVILPPSTGKSILVNTAEDKNELSEATQEFIDAIYLHNGRPVPSLSKEVTPQSSIQQEVEDTIFQKIRALLDSIDPDVGYDDWLHAGMAVFHETKGTSKGFELFDRWSSKGKKYRNTREIEDKWRSFQLDIPNPVTMGTLIKMAQDAGTDIAAIMNNGDSFEPCEYEVVGNDKGTSIKSAEYNNPLDKYSLQGMSQEIEKDIKDQVHVLGEIALLGQSTVIYAAPNTGKTLLTMSLLIKSINQEQVDPNKVYYLNMDDSANGLLEKLRIAEEYGFHMLAQGYLDFKVSVFLDTIKDMVNTNKAKDVIIILDTLKRFTDLMDKKVTSHFTAIIREFDMKGGTVIALAHTNKNPGRDGKQVYGGTSDILDDFDCAYILDTISNEANTKVVEFRNIKKRGNVALSVSYSYAEACNISYTDLLLSVQEVDPNQLISIKYEVENKSDAEVITATENCIKEGINTKMKLIEKAAERAKISKRAALKVIDKYTGDDPFKHRWSFAVRERGAKVFELLERPPEHEPAPPITTP